MSQYDHPTEESLSSELKALKAQDVALKNALNVAELGMWSWDLEDSVYCDERSAACLGLSGAGLVAVADFLVRFKSEGHVRLLDALDAARGGQGVFDELFELDNGQPANGGQLRLQGQLSTCGQVLSGIIRRMPSDRGEAAEGLAQGADAFKIRMYQFLYLSPNLCIEQDADGYVRWSNPACELILGYTSGEFIGQPFLDFVHSDDIARIRQLSERILSGELLTLEDPLEVRCRMKSGGYRWLSLTWTVSQDRRLIYAIALDVTVTKEQQQQLVETLAKVQDSNTELQSFASVASHDLREPLRMISSYLRLLQERWPEALDARAVRYINYACEGADRMRRLIEDLLSYSRLDGGTCAHEAVALDEVLADAIGHLSVTIKKVGAEVTVDINNSPVVVGDRTRLLRLFQNLLANAIKFQPEGNVPRVSVGFADGDVVDEQGKWVVTIQDNGIGIDPDHLDLLFNVFRRLNTRDEFEGSGIGLAVCQKIVEQHDGRIWIASDLGQGSTFYVTLDKLDGTSISG